MHKELNMLLISRRRYTMAGTRFHARGLDDNGNVANFVETELVINYDNSKFIFSHTQIRGSVPVFWSQKSSSRNIKIKTDHSLTELSFGAHMQSLIENYQRVVILNLLSEQKQQEHLLSNKFFELYDQSR